MMSDFDEIYRLYAGNVYRFLLRMSGNPDVAEELTSETFYRAVKNIDSFHGSCKISVWLCGIAKNLYTDYLRKSERKNVSLEGREHPDGGDIILRFEDKEQVLGIHRILHTLDEPYKEVFSLRVFSFDGYLVPDEYNEIRREHLEGYYNMIKDKETDIKMVLCEYNETLNDLKMVHSMFSVKTDGLPAVKFEIFDMGGKYVVSCFIEGTYDETDEFCSFINRMDFMIDPIMVHDYKFEMTAVNADDRSRDLYVSRYRIVGERYSDGEFYNEAYSTALLERMYEMNRSGIYCDDFSVINSRFDTESKRFLGDIYAVFTDPVTQNKIAYIRTIQWRFAFRYTILDEFEPTIIDGGVSPETFEKVKNLF